MDAYRTATSGVAERTGQGRTRTVPRWSVPLLAAAAGVVVWGAGTALGVEAVAQGAAGDMRIGAVTVILTALLVGLAGWGVRAVLRRFGTPRAGRTAGERTWMVACAVVLLASLLGPLGAASVSATVLLAALHVTVGAVVALGLRH
ncbi:DUF6069 family protein [Oerskovia enterophila]|uniref:Uncharacterized protein n=1 Tax=Oerskovia enterophila TaxID=43678 RepID=A0ABX2Y170_9CELL|nr:DUF6069 family protein [Oerskovia enterophila]OCI30082.1 hypothetical protein OERS_32360 [Oerskovia enterophila]